MLDGPTIASSIHDAGFSHVVWIPDSHLGTWETAIEQSSLVLVRPTREGEAVAIAAGLLIGGAKPLVLVQCTGFFEAGDAVRNVVHDMKLPLKLVVGVRSWQAVRDGKSRDNCPTFAEPVVRAWGLPFTWIEPTADIAACRTAFATLAAADSASVLLWAE